MERIKENLATFIALAIFGPAVGWFLGTSQMAQIANDVAAIKRTVDELKVKNDMRTTFDECTKMRLFAIENGVKRLPECVKGN